MPVLFVGHGHPLNALADNEYTRALALQGQLLEKPTAILVISAHWETVGTAVSVNPLPRTIHDFGPFDNRLFQIDYPAPGHPDLARELQGLVTNTHILEDETMGLDHGAWTVLKFLRPEADTPVFEMSLDYTKPAAFHYQLGRELKALRSRGVLIVCSGNIVHNLTRTIWNDINAAPFDWNLEFDAFVKQQIDNRNFDALVSYQSLGAASQLAIPTSDHYLPMLYTLGLSDHDDPITHFYEGYQYGGISMRCFQAG